MEESPGKIYALTVVLTSLATVAVGLRFYSRHIKKAGLSWDDWAVLPALVWQPCSLNTASPQNLLRKSRTQIRKSVANDEQLLTYAMAISMIIGAWFRPLLTV